MVGIYVSDDDHDGEPSGIDGGAKKQAERYRFCRHSIHNARIQEKFPPTQIRNDDSPFPNLPIHTSN